jgi:hypothetical protein
VELKLLNVGLGRGFDPDTLPDTATRGIEDMGDVACLLADRVVVAKIGSINNMNVPVGWSAQGLDMFEPAPTSHCLLQMTPAL